MPHVPPSSFTSSLVHLILSHSLYLISFPFLPKMSTFGISPQNQSLGHVELFCCDIFLRFISKQPKWSEQTPNSPLTTVLNKLFTVANIFVTPESFANNAASPNQ